MPVTGLYFSPDSGTIQNPAAAIADRLSKRFQPTNIGKFSLEHRLLRSPHSGSSMQYLDLSHHPSHRFCCITSPPPVPPTSSIVTISSEFETILTTKLQGLWALRQTLKAEGSMFELEDFRVKIATLSQGSVMKGVIVEVEYLPCEYGEVGEPIIKDFIERLGLMNNTTGAWRPYLGMNREGREEGEVFGELDTGMQYMELLKLR